MSFADPSKPNLPDFILFCQGQGVLAGYLDPASDYYQWALTHAVNTVLDAPQIPGIEYVIAVYNFGMHWLVGHAPDVSGLTIASITWTAGAAIVTPAVALGFPTGQTVNVQIGAVLPLAYNGCFAAMVLGADSFAYGLETNPGAVTNEGVFGYRFFADLRKQFGLLSIVAGPIQESHDENTGQTLVVPDFFKTITMGDLDLMKTPWGRAYLAYAQKAGPTVVGVS